MDKARSWIALCAAAVACSAPRAEPDRAATPVEISSAPAPTPLRGIRLVYGVTPSDDASIAKALEGARHRVAGTKLETSFDIQQEGRAIVATIGPTDATTMEMLRGLIPGARLAVAPLADADTTLVTAKAKTPAGIALGREHVPHGGQTVEVTFAWSEALPSKSAGRHRLTAWLAEATGARGSFAFGPYAPDDAPTRKAVRSYALDGASIALAVDDAQVLDGDLPALGVTLAPSSARAFEALTEERVSQRLALLMDGWVISTPLVRSKIAGGKLIISPDTRYGADAALEEARDLEIKLRMSHGGPKLELERMEKTP